MSAQARALLAAHRRSLETLLAMNERAEVDRVTRRILDDLSDQARTYLARIARHEPDPTAGFRWSTLGMFGPNGCGPAIADLVRQSEFHRCRPSQHQIASGRSKQEIAA